MARAPPVTSYTVASTGAAVVVDEATLLLLVDDTTLVAVLLPVCWDADADSVFADPAAEEDFDLLFVVFVFGVEDDDDVLVVDGDDDVHGMQLDVESPDTIVASY